MGLWVSVVRFLCIFAGSQIAVAIEKFLSAFIATVVSWRGIEVTRLGSVEAGCGQSLIDDVFERRF